MRTVSSLQNPVFKQLKKLGSSSKERRKSGLTMLEGYTLLETYLAAGFNPQSVICSSQRPDKQELESLCEARGIAVYEFTPALYAEVSSLEHPDGCLSLVAIPKPAQKSFAEFCVFLEGIQDPGNLGSMIRTAAAAGATQVYLFQCADAWSPKVLRGSMGAHFSLEIFENWDLDYVFSAFPGKVYATTAASTESLFDCDLTGPIAFVFGNEGAGISPVVQTLAHYRVSIPMPGKLESLNAAAAAAVCCFERVRQKQARRSKSRK